MTTLSKDEVMRLAREAGGLPDPMVFYAAYERFATLCRADLVAENERLELIASSAWKVADECTRVRDALRAEVEKYKEIK